MLIDIPYMHCWVVNRFIIKDEPPGVTEAYAYSITVLPNRPIFFNVHTVHGALYSRLPLYALRSRNIEQPEGELPGRHFLEPWGSLGTKANVLQHVYLKDYNALLHRYDADPFIKGRYLFSIDFSEGGFAEDPEQHKTLHLISLETGQYALLPNNELLFKDDHFTDSNEPPSYKRNSTYFQSHG